MSAQLSGVSGSGELNVGMYMGDSGVASAILPIVGVTASASSA